jgi:hypothetical protein
VLQACDFSDPGLKGRSEASRCLPQHVVVSLFFFPTCWLSELEKLLVVFFSRCAPCRLCLLIYHTFRFRRSSIAAGRPSALAEIRLVGSESARPLPSRFGNSRWRIGAVFSLGLGHRKPPVLDGPTFPRPWPGAQRRKQSVDPKPHPSGLRCKV